MYVAYMHVTYENTVRKSDVSVEAYAFAKLTGDRARYARRQDSTEACETGFVGKYRQSEADGHQTTSCLTSKFICKSRPDRLRRCIEAFSARLGSKILLDRRDSSCSAGWPKSLPLRPILRPLRRANKFRPDCLQV